MEISTLEESAAWKGDRKAEEWRWWPVKHGGPGLQDGGLRIKTAATWGKLTEAEGMASTEAGMHLECQRGLVAEVE